MKSIKTRLISAFLLVMTILSLFPTTAFAATSTGTGIKPTSNTNYWTTRLLHDGTPYSYKPPMAAGKLLYCLDRGYGYRWGTASFLNSYTSYLCDRRGCGYRPEDGAGAERHG